MAASSHGATFDLTEAGQRQREEQEKLLREFELRRRIRSTVVPTDDFKVRTMLRALGEPITLFGEKEMERRERLRKLLAEREAAGEGGIEGAPLIGQVVVEEVEVQKELFFTEGEDALVEARKAIAAWSLPRAAARLAAAKQLRQGGLDVLKALDKARCTSESAARRLSQISSEIGDDRPISDLRFSGDGSLMATCGWSGAVALWTADAACKRVMAFRAATERLTGIAWHPNARPQLHLQQQDVAAAAASSSDTVALGTGCADGTAALWSEGGKLLRKLEGHTDRLGRVAFHPMGMHFATASYDMTWRLWDIETGSCLMEQEGHSRQVYSVAFHPDGSLAGSVGLDAYGRIWDCRTGRSVFVLQGHVRQVLAIDFAPDGYHVATGGDDHTAKVWDLRQRKALYTLPAHTSLISTVRWQPGTGHVLLTASFDRQAKLWSTRNWRCLRVCSGHEGKVMAADLCPTWTGAGAEAAAAAAADVDMQDSLDADQQQQQQGSSVGQQKQLQRVDGGVGYGGSFDMLMGSVSYDRTLKVWAPEEGLPDIIADSDSSSGDDLSGSEGEEDGAMDLG